MGNICPHCGDTIEELRYNANFSETIYGNSWGFCSLDGNDLSCDGQETNDSGNFDEYDIEYLCPSCDSYISPNELKEEEEEEEEETVDSYNIRQHKIINS
jgi:hypothetical protein